MEARDVGHSDKECGGSELKPGLNLLFEDNSQ